jgi:hypothetical protein
VRVFRQLTSWPPLSPETPTSLVLRLRGCSREQHINGLRHVAERFLAAPAVSGIDQISSAIKLMTLEVDSPTKGDQTNKRGKYRREQQSLSSQLMPLLLEAWSKEEALELEP